MKFTRFSSMIVGLYAISVNAAMAQNSPWTIDAGPVWLQQHIQATVEAPRGTPVPGASFAVNNVSTLGVDIGYDITPKWTARLTLGVPLNSTLHGTGTLGPLGSLGKLSYGPAVASITYQIGKFGVFQPYVGAGVAYLLVLSAHGEAVSNFKVDNAFGEALQIGTNIQLNKQWGLFVDVKKVFLKTNVYGTLGTTAAYTRASFNPLVIQTGVSYRF